MLLPNLQPLKRVAGRHWFGAYRNVVVCYWAQICTPDELRSLRASYRTLASEGKTTVSVLHYVEQGAGLPLPQSRNDLVGKSDMHLVSLGCVGVVLAGSGFWVSALSSFTMGVRMLLPAGGLALRVTRDLAEMQPWFAEQHLRTTGERLEPGSLDAWIEQARTALVGE